MWERTITVGSAGKTFNITGWRTGWAYGPAKLLHNLHIIHQNCVYACTTPIQVCMSKYTFICTNIKYQQEAIALGFEKELTRLGTDECYFISLPHELEAKRDFMAKILTDVGMKPIIPEGGYFMVTNWSSLGKSGKQSS